MLKIALVGCGKIGQTHAQALAVLEESKFVAACDIELERASSFAARFQVKPYDDLTRMLTENSIEVLCIATPPPDGPGRIFELAAVCDQPHSRRRRLD